MGLMFWTEVHTDDGNNDYRGGASAPRLDNTGCRARGGAGCCVRVSLHPVCADLDSRGRSGCADRSGSGFRLLAHCWSTCLVHHSAPGRRAGRRIPGSLAEVLFGVAAGTPLLVTGIMEGLGAEIVFGARRWRDYSLPTVLLAGAVAMLVALPWNWYRLGYFQLNPGFLIVLLVVRLLSGAILSGLLAKVIGDAL